MKWLPFKLTEQEKQALKEAGKRRPFKSFQKEMVVYVILLILAVALFWRHYSILTLIIVTMAGVISVRYSASLRASKATLSVANKVEAELKKQQESALKFRPKVFLFVVLPLILLLAGVVFYVVYLPTYKERKEPIGGEEANQPIDETAGWRIYRNEDIGFVVKYPNDWTYDYRGTIETNPNWFVSFQKKDETQPKVELPGGFQEEAEYNIRIYVKNNLEHYSAEDYVSNLLALQRRMEPEEFRERQIATTTVDGGIAMREVVFSAPSSGPCIQVNTAHGDYLYMFEYCATAHPETHEKFIGIFDEMLSTFRFLE